MYAGNQAAQNILSVDVEDWFHILELNSTPKVDTWKGFDSRVERALGQLLDMFDETGVKVTCFFLAWLGDRYPELVRDTHRRGHEIASHGYAHQLVYTQSREAFAEDIRRSNAILEDVIGGPVNGYRAPGFSITTETPWAMAEIAAAGYTYDSSLFPARRGHGGVVNAALGPHVIDTVAGSLVEFPITVVSVLGQRICFFGGGYLRLFPYSLIRCMSTVVNRAGRPVI